MAEVDEAIAILLAAQAAHWAPIGHAQRGQVKLHDCGSYRWLCQPIQRARRTGQPLPVYAQMALFGSTAS